jgi:hypothetical protein
MSTGNKVTFPVSDLSKDPESVNNSLLFLALVNLCQEKEYGLSFVYDPGFVIEGGSDAGPVFYPENKGYLVEVRGYSVSEEGKEKVYPTFKDAVIAGCKIFVNLPKN